MEENKIGTVPVSRLVISMGLPLMLSLLISSLYNFVDSVVRRTGLRGCPDGDLAGSSDAADRVIARSRQRRWSERRDFAGTRRKESEKGKRCGERGNFYRILFVDLKLYSMSCLRPHLF